MNNEEFIDFDKLLQELEEETTNSLIADESPEDSEDESTEYSKNEDRFIIDTMVWSFSRLSSYYQCPYGFHLKYIECNKGEPNFFAQYGSFMHKILEKYAKGELSIFEITSYYTKNFDKEITCKAPYNRTVDLRQSYYEKGEDYLNNIDLILDSYEILGIEKEVKFTIGQYELIGYIDLLLRDKETQEITVLDHKSGTIKFKKNGDISKTDLGHVKEFKHQLYLYSIAVEKEYGVKPKYLVWNLFKQRGWLTVDFDDSEYAEAINWAEETVKKIENETEWKPNPDMFFCNNICDMRNHACEYKP